MNPTPSIRRRLLWLLLSVVSVIWLLAGWQVYEDARHEVDEVYDASLAQSARVLLGLLGHEVEEEAETRVNVARVSAELDAEALGRYPQLAAILNEYLEPQHEHIQLMDRSGHSGHRYEAKMALLARYADGEALVQTPNAPAFPNTPNGFSDHQDAQGRWRVFSITDAETGLLVQVGERQEVRRELVRYITANTLTPLLISLPVLALLLWLAVGQGLRPLAQVADEVAQRAPDALGAIPLQDRPCEVHPLLDSLNSLFARLDRALQQERRFTADAAHELRTPLAALRTQAQVALREPDAARRAQALNHIQQGVDRATHLVEQLLALARADAGNQVGEGMREVALGPLLGELLGELVDDALQRGAEVAFEDGGGRVRADPAALRILARNLIDNAVRYGGPGVHVEVRTRVGVEGNAIEVVDDGPGIPAAQRESVLRRFHRGLGVEATGSGLGLSIVQRIAEVHGARLVLEDGPGGRGLRVRVIFP